MATRPVQEMADSAAAIRAAREVQADVSSPETYRNALEAFAKAKREYRFKNFARAEEYAKQARLLAEQAELDAMRSGQGRSEMGGVDPYSDLPDAPPAAKLPPPPKTPPYEYPKPEPVPLDRFEEQARPKPVPSPS